MTLLSPTYLSKLKADCLRIYEATRSASPLVDEDREILRQVEMLLQASCVAYLEVGQRLDLPNLPDDAQTTNAEQIAAAYCDVQLRFEDLKAAVYELGKALLDDEHTCEQGAALIDALVAIAPGYRDAKKLHQFARHFVPACTAFAKEDWEVARKELVSASKIDFKKDVVTEMLWSACRRPMQAASQAGALEELNLHRSAWQQQSIRSCFAGDQVDLYDREALGMYVEAHYQAARNLAEKGAWHQAADFFRFVFREDADHEGDCNWLIQQYPDLVWLLKPRELCSLVGSSDGFRTFKWSPDGKSIVTVGNNSTARMLNVLDGELLAEVGDAQDVSWSPDGQRLALVTNGSIIVWEPASRQRRYIMGEGVREIAWSPDGQLLASAGLTLQLWNATTGKTECVLSRENPKGASIGWSCDSCWLASYANNEDSQEVRIYNVRSRSKTGIIENGGQFAWSPVGPWLVILKVWAGEGAEVWWAKGDGTEMSERIDEIRTSDSRSSWGRNFHEAAWGPDGRQLFLRENDTMVVWNFDTRVAQRHGMGYINWGGMRMHPDIRGLFSAGYYSDKKTYVCHQGHPHPFTVLFDLPGSIHEWSPDGQRLATTDGGRVILWGYAPRSSGQR